MYSFSSDLKENIILFYFTFYSCLISESQLKDNCIKTQNPQSSLSSIQLVDNKQK